MSLQGTYAVGPTFEALFIGLISDNFAYGLDSGIGPETAITRVYRTYSALCPQMNVEMNR